MMLNFVSVEKKNNDELFIKVEEKWMNFLRYSSPVLPSIRLFEVVCYKIQIFIPVYPPSYSLFFTKFLLDFYFCPPLLASIAFLHTTTTTNIN